MIQENRDFFAAHGVDLGALESSHAKDGNGKKASSRSDTTMLIKNLPHDVVEDELEVMFGRFGAVASLLVPKSKSVALVDFVEPSEARAAFKGLAYRKYHHVPLYLEWAPLGTIDKEKAKAVAKLKPKEAPSSSSAKKEDEEDYSTLFVKNLKFSTDEAALCRHIEDQLGRAAGGECRGCEGRGGTQREAVIALALAPYILRVLLSCCCLSTALLSHTAVITLSRDIGSEFIPY